MRALLVLGWTLTACQPLDGEASDLSSDPFVRPPPARPDLYLGWMSPGASTGVTVTGISAGDEIHLARSDASGPGPCWDVLDGLCLDLAGPVRRFLIPMANRGEYELVLYLPW